MARAILVNAVDWPYTASCLMPDNGLASLAGCLRAAGHQAEIRDLGSLDTLERNLSRDLRSRLQSVYEDLENGAPGAADQAHGLEAEFGDSLEAAYNGLFSDLSELAKRGAVELLGLKLWMGHGARLALSLADELVKRWPSVHLVAGGPLATLAPEYVLEACPGLVALCVGEGEEAIVGLAAHSDGRTRLEAIPNLVFRDGGALRATERRVPNLSELPDPVYDPETYPTVARDQLPIACISESRGCPMDCPFCVHGRVHGQSWRTLDAKTVVRQMHELGVDHKIRAFRFSGSFTPGALYRDVARELSSQGRALTYSGFSHVNGIGIEDLPLLRRSGLCALFFGIESGSRKLLEGGLGKRIHPSRVARVVRACLEDSIFVVGSVIFPAPGETSATEAETLELLTELFAGQEGAVPVVPPLPEPGSRWFEEWSRFGFSGTREGLVDALCQRPPHPLLPVHLTHPLPYGLDGQSSTDVVLRSIGFARLLEASGVLTNVTDEMVLVARAAGLTARELRDLDRRMFATADVDRIRDLLARIREPAPRGLPMERP